jgi:hypothetical protein
MSFESSLCNVDPDLVRHFVAKVPSPNLYLVFWSIEQSLIELRFSIFIKLNLSNSCSVVDWVFGVKSKNSEKKPLSWDFLLFCSKMQAYPYIVYLSIIYLCIYLSSNHLSIYLSIHLSSISPMYLSIYYLSSIIYLSTYLSSIYKSSIYLSSIYLSSVNLSIIYLSVIYLVCVCFTLDWAQGLAC